MQSTINNAFLILAAQPGALFAKVMEHGSMSVEIYKPVETDKQTPHLQDELYVILSGSGEFMNGSERAPFSPGDVLFVPAGVEHRFENFTADFATWVIFYGPVGGEKDIVSLKS
ncbi:MAG TPA: cupin domain-containing protein [Mucilaginibacter sp.]|jgi:mannose-6-phosphate isomerase-like protein (cupin superfamily)|nr:cupin domain-containing protein [Mucilaginibacter sp.]